ncbi:ferredoxin subunit of nitrite reductase and ring-hydroxylating dioxygenase [Beggiatoa alba B18LD]|uniref:Ferredoxin subunit of nitrite reductase and ring-hydroxylating dioxygenase n=1 Tax=Beggiatoa alba B18LD TaxID=395493 RepID=I3CCM2_9GAMM|nr:Rieske 2Fe-2S domain-containing protein [Beggiatoa alba]EIJ41365.1 ferredoxin subunit of nitrite reductase and ring-hydroxylating dioxygenase [Beggiatoa alba B18LD]
MKTPEQWIKVCPSDALIDRRHIIKEVLYDNQPESIIICRFEGQCYAYINRCVHMPKRLNCEHDIIFDLSGKFLRCSMHGIIYTPDTGTSQSTMCNGEQLKAVKVTEKEGMIYLNDKHIHELTK